MKPIIAITMGDPAGIGPEIIVKALSLEETYEKCRPLVTGDANIMQWAVDQMGSDLKIHRIASVKEALFELGTIDVYDLACIDMDTFQPGVLQNQCGHAAFISVTTAIQLAMENEVDATVTAPLNKEALHNAGHNFDGHTEIYAHYTHTKKYAMLLADEHLRVIHVSTHVPLRVACDRVKKDRIIEVTELIHDACKQFGIENPRIGIAGLNPHASDGGQFGSEEKDMLIPAAQMLRERGVDISDPIGADSVFAQAAEGRFDAVMSLYHDQGHIAAKTYDFERTISATLGLPCLRTSVDHGTAFDIAWQNKAQSISMTTAIETLVRYV